MKRHRHFVNEQVKNSFSHQDKKKYPLFPIKLASLLGLPEETLAGLPVLSAKGRHRICVENYTSVRSFESDKIVLSCPETSITILGSHLKIERLNQDEIHVEGMIHTVTYQ